MNSKTLVISLLIFLLLFAALMLRSGDVAWLALPFLCYLAAGVLQSPARETVRLEAQRAVSRTRPANASAADPQDIPLVEVQVTVRNLGAPLARLDVSDVLPEGMAASGGQLRRIVALGSGEEVQLSYTCRERRGSYTWNAVRALVSDPFGLVETEYLLPARGEVQVQPQRDPLRRLPLRPRSTLHSPGSIPARLAGSGTDFWGVREYQPGDPLRWLDWRLTARHPHRFFTREFEQEEIADIGLILDAREKTDLRREVPTRRAGLERDNLYNHPVSAAGPERDNLYEHPVGAAGPELDSLFEHSVGATAALAETFLHQGHRVSLLAFGGKVEMVFAGYGKGQLNKIMRCLANLHTGTSRLSDVLEYLPIRMFSSRALLIVVSPLERGDWPFFLKLRASGYQGLLISPNPFDFITRPPAGSAAREPALPELPAHDPVTRLGLRAARLERCLELRDIAQLQIPVIDWRVSQPLYPLVRSALNRSWLRREESAL